MADAPVATFVRKHPKPWRIAVGLVLVVGGELMTSNPADAPESRVLLIAALAAIWLVMGFGVWLIASGIPKWLGPQDFMDARRLGWQRLLGLGFLVMAGGAFGFAAISMPMGSVVVALVYWFGWSWISWRLADQSARRHFGAPLSASAPAPEGPFTPAAKRSVGN